jgi:hypothetical protein
MPWSISTVSAWVVDQLKLDEKPIWMDEGLAANEIVGSGFVTATLTWAVVVPPVPVAVIV